MKSPQMGFSSQDGGGSTLDPESGGWAQVGKEERWASYVETLLERAGVRQGQGGG